MRIDMEKELTTLDGKVIGKMKQFCVESLLAVFEDERNLMGQEKLNRFILAKKIYEGEGEIEIPIEDISLLKKLVGKGYGALIVGQAWEILEGK